MFETAMVLLAREPNKVELVSKRSMAVRARVSASGKRSSSAAPASQRICAILQLRLQAHQPRAVEGQHRQADDHDQHDRHVGQDNSAGIVPERPSESRALFEDGPSWCHRAHSIVLDACYTKSH